MEDQDLYLAIGQLLVDESPQNATQLNVSMCLKPSYADFALWEGEKMSQDSSILLSKDGREEMVRLFRELQQAHVQQNMGKWNLAFFTLDTEKGSFHVDLENNKDLERGKLKLWRYRQKFQ